MAAPHHPLGSRPAFSGYAESAYYHPEAVRHSFGFLTYENRDLIAQPQPVVNGLVWDDANVLSVNHYHVGDHHHHHHQRQVHHFHDLHLMGTADETLDLRGTPAVSSQIIPGDAPPQLKLRPDEVGLFAFAGCAQQIGRGLGDRFDRINVDVAPPPQHQPQSVPYYHVPLRRSSSPSNAPLSVPLSAPLSSVPGAYSSARSRVTVERRSTTTAAGASTTNSSSLTASPPVPTPV